MFHQNLANVKLSPEDSWEKFCVW